MNEDLVILLTEDDEGHATLIKRNLRRSGLRNSILHFNNGEKILNYLIGEGEESDWKPGTPFVILLDIRMPKISGYQVLRSLKEHVTLQNIPVIVVSTSDNPEMMDKCHDLGCLNYIIKPVDYTQFTNTIRQLGLYIKNIDVPRIDWSCESVGNGGMIPMPDTQLPSIPQ